MTGIERLRRLARSQNMDNAWTAMLANELCDIAGQIEREQVSVSRCDTLTQDVSMSAYDLLPQEEREAIAWVREHGGIAYVKDAWNVRSNLKRQLDTAQAKVERQQRHIMFVQTKCRERQNRVVELKKTVEFLKFNNSNFRALQADVAERLGFTRYGDDYEPEDLLDALDRRLMPEGMEWLVEAWPRFEDDAPVRFLDDFERYGDESGISVVTMYSDGSFALNCRAYSRGERVKRPAPKVLDADGVEIRVGDTVWDVEFGCEFVVTKVADGTVFVAYEDVEDDRRDPASLTHRAPVLAADGRPLREGEKPYRVDNGKQVEIRRIDPSNGESCVFVGVDGRSYGYWLRPDQLTHERPDSWERLEEDAGCTATKYNERRGTIFTTKQQVARDLVRRAKKLAERGQ